MFDITKENTSMALLWWGKGMYRIMSTRTPLLPHRFPTGPACRDARRGLLFSILRSVARIHSTHDLVRF